MSQNRHKKPEFNSIRSIGFERVFYSLLIICLAGMFVFASGSAQASIKANPTPNSRVLTKTSKGPTYVLKTNLAVMANKDEAILDWRTQSFELAFDLPANDWYESLDLFLSAAPEGQVARGTPLMISYNGTKAVPIYGRGSRFDAHIRMDTSRIRLSRNNIKISYQTPRNANCLMPNHGKWVLDLGRSKLVAKARTKKRTMQISEIEQRLSHAMTAPKRVTITAKGTGKRAYEALAAQGIALRMSDVPEFKLTSGPSDMVFIIGTHDDVRPLLHNKSILDNPGARVVIDNGIKPKIVLTAETEDQVLELVRAFATYHLPKARRAESFLHEFYSGDKFNPQANVDSGTYKLSELGVPILGQSWRPEPALINFNVADPHASSGVLTLKILSAKDINPQSRLSVKLNDKSIGFTPLNKSSKMVEFRIKPGMLRASQNQLRIVPQLTPTGWDPSHASASICQSQQYIPTVMVSSASKIRLTSSKPTPQTDLSRLAASGAPFDKNSVVILTATNIKDREASLQFLGYAAHKFGPQWANANYVTTLPSRDNLDKNVLIIGPNPLGDPALYAAAPRSLQLALGKNQSNLPQNRQIAGADKYASSNARDTFQISARTGSAARLKSGGIAGLFASPYGHGRMIGVISADRPARFSTAMKSVANQTYWNGLQGSVARWDNAKILMAQTAVPLPVGFALPQSAPQTGLPKFVAGAKEWLASISAKKLKIKKPNFGRAGEKTPAQKLPTQDVQQPDVLASVQPAPLSAVRTQNNKTPEFVTPVQTVSNNPQIGSAGLSRPDLKLRGGLSARPEATQTRQNDKKSVSSWPKFSKLKMPSLTNIKLKGFQAKRDLTAWWAKASHQAFEATPLRQWWKELTGNRAAFFGLLVFLAFFVTALASPMSLRRKK